MSYSQFRSGLLYKQLYCTLGKCFRKIINGVFYKKTGKEEIFNSSVKFLHEISYDNTTKPDNV